MQTHNFRIYSIDRALPQELTEEYIRMENIDDIIPGIYKKVWKSLEPSLCLDDIFDKYADRLDFSDIIEIDKGSGVCEYYILTLFGFEEHSCKENK